MCKTMRLKFNTFQGARTIAVSEKLVRSLYFKKSSVILIGLGFLCTDKIVSLQEGFNHSMIIEWFGLEGTLKLTSF